MSRGVLARVLLAGTVLLTGLLALLARDRPPARRQSTVRGVAEPASPRAEREAIAIDAAGFLYGRVTTVDGTTYEGRLRFDGLEEAFWSDLFNGRKSENRWADFVPEGELPTASDPIRIFGLELARREHPIDLERPFAVRFGDLVRLEASIAGVRATLKSGTEVELDRFESGDFDDGIRVWDAARGVVDLDTLKIAAIEFTPAPARAEVPRRLHGRVQTRHGDFTGFLAWSGRGAVDSDAFEVEGRAIGHRFDGRLGEVRTIERTAGGGLRVTTVDGRVVTPSGVGIVAVDDRRFGRVQIGWNDFERLDFDDAGGLGSGPAYAAFAPGAPLAGRVTLADGRTLAGRLVFDLDESESTDRLDAPFESLHYSLPFASIASIERPAAPGAAPAFVRVTTHVGDELRVEPRGDLGDANAGLLIFAPGAERPEYARWADVRRIDFDPPPAAD